MVQSESNWELFKEFNFQLIESIDKKYICVICKSVLVNAYQGSCECRYCKECVHVHFDNMANTCPGNKDKCKTIYGEKKNDIYVDQDTNKILLSLKVKCLKASCAFITEFYKMDNHMKFCNSFKELNSIWKLIKIFDKQLNETKSHDLICVICKTILANAYQGKCGCRYCQECYVSHFSDLEAICPGKTKECSDVIIRSDIVIDHNTNNKLLKLKVKCPKQSCKDAVEFGNIENHMKSCNKQYKDCPYRRIGCKKEQIDIQFISKHLLSSDFVHSELLMKYLMWFDKKFVEFDDKYSKLSSKIASENINQQLMQEINKLKLLINNNINEINNLKIHIEEIHEKERKLRTEMGYLDEKINNLEIKTKNLEDLIKSKEDPLKHARFFRDENLSILNNNSYSNYKERLDINKRINSLENLIKNQNEFVWTISDFKEKRQAAMDGKNEELLSKRFFSEKNGYKMRLRLFLNGYNSGRNSHFSIFFTVLKGNYGHLLSFRNVTISLIDQTTNIPYKPWQSDHEKSRSSDMNPFQAANSGEKAESWYGCYDFVEISKVVNDLNLIKNDCIILKCLASSSS